MTEDEEPYENTLSVEELRLETRRAWNAASELIKALHSLPEVPHWSVLKLLNRSSRWPEDMNRGKALQQKHGLDAIPPKTEYECGAGVWSRIRDGLLMVDKKKDNG